MKLRLFLAALIISLTGMVYAQQTSGELPAVTLKNINGKTINTSELTNDGKPIIISFFATWCKPCNRELSALQQMSQAFCEVSCWSMRHYTDIPLL